MFCNYCSEGSTKPETHFKVGTIQIESENHSSDLSLLYLKSIPNEFNLWVDGSELPFMTDYSTNNFCDIIFEVEEKLFRCHKVNAFLIFMFCPFFDKLLVVSGLLLRTK